LEWNDVAQGLLKPFAFSFVVSLVGCYYGLRTTGGTQGVGRATTRAVVVASVIIFVLAFFIGKIFVIQSAPWFHQHGYVIYRASEILVILFKNLSQVVLTEGSTLAVLPRSAAAMAAAERRPRAEEQHSNRRHLLSITFAFKLDTKLGWKLVLD
jgi:ABC-type transporter Mla maintaining outer membrane lipid asymmetry permease subunit MlaE